jgi:hypothetical protein
MNTRIKYTKQGNKIISPFYKNYEGMSLSIEIVKSSDLYGMFILTNKNDCLEYEVRGSLSSAKRLARKLLIEKYNVRLNEEIRIKQ